MRGAGPLDPICHKKFCSLAVRVETNTPVTILAQVPSGACSAVERTELQRCASVVGQGWQKRATTTRRALIASAWLDGSSRRESMLVVSLGMGGFTCLLPALLSPIFRVSHVLVGGLDMIVGVGSPTPTPFRGHFAETRSKHSFAAAQDNHHSPTSPCNVP